MLKNLGGASYCNHTATVGKDGKGTNNGQHPKYGQGQPCTIVLDTGMTTAAKCLAACKAEKYCDWWDYEEDKNTVDGKDVVMKECFLKSFFHNVTKTKAKGVFGKDTE